MKSITLFVFILGSVTAPVIAYYLFPALLLSLTPFLGIIPALGLIGFFAGFLALELLGFGLSRVKRADPAYSNTHNLIKISALLASVIFGLLLGFTLGVGLGVVGFVGLAVLSLIAYRVLLSASRPERMESLAGAPVQEQNAPEPVSASLTVPGLIPPVSAPSGAPLLHTYPPFATARHPGFASDSKCGEAEDSVPLRVPFTLDPADLFAGAFHIYERFSYFKEFKLSLADIDEAQHLLSLIAINADLQGEILKLEGSFDLISAVQAKVAAESKETKGKEGKEVKTREADAREIARFERKVTQLTRNLDAKIKEYGKQLAAIQRKSELSRENEDREEKRKQAVALDPERVLYRAERLLSVHAERLKLIIVDARVYGGVRVNDPSLSPLFTEIQTVALLLHTELHSARRIEARTEAERKANLNFDKQLAQFKAAVKSAEIKKIELQSDIKQILTLGGTESSMDQGSDSAVALFRDQVLSLMKAELKLEEGKDIDAKAENAAMEALKAKVIQCLQEDKDWIALRSKPNINTFEGRKFNKKYPASVNTYLAVLRLLYFDFDSLDPNGYWETYLDGSTDASRSVLYTGFSFRRMVAYLWLSFSNIEQTVDKDNAIGVLIGALADIRRAHNDDSPAYRIQVADRQTCGPGAKGRLLDIVAANPKYQKTMKPLSAFADEMIREWILGKLRTQDAKTSFQIYQDLMMLVALMPVEGEEGLRKFLKILSADKEKICNELISKLREADFFSKFGSNNEAAWRNKVEKLIAAKLASFGEINAEGHLECEIQNLPSDFNEMSLIAFGNYLSDPSDSADFKMNFENEEREIDHFFQDWDAQQVCGVISPAYQKPREIASKLAKTKDRLQKQLERIMLASQALETGLIGADEKRKEIINRKISSLLEAKSKITEFVKRCKLLEKLINSSQASEEVKELESRRAIADVKEPGIHHSELKKMVETYLTPSASISASGEKDKKIEFCIQIVSHYLTDSRASVLLRQSAKGRDALDQILDVIFQKTSGSEGEEKSNFTSEDHQKILEGFKSLDFRERAVLNKRLKKFGLNLMITLPHLREQFRDLPPNLSLSGLEAIASRKVLKQHYDEKKAILTDNLGFYIHIRAWQDCAAQLISPFFDDKKEIDLKSVRLNNLLPEKKAAAIKRITDFFCMTLLHNVQFAEFSAADKERLSKLIEAYFCFTIADKKAKCISSFPPKFNWYGQVVPIGLDPVFKEERDVWRESMTVYEAIHSLAHYLSTLTTTFHTHPASFDFLSMGLIRFIDADEAEKILENQSYGSYLIRISASKPDSFIFSLKVGDKVVHTTVEEGRKTYKKRAEEQKLVEPFSDPFLCSLLYLERRDFNQSESKSNPDLSAEEKKAVVPHNLEISLGASLIPFALDEKKRIMARKERLLRYYEDCLGINLFNLKDKFFDKFWVEAQTLTVNTSSKNAAEWESFALRLTGQEENKLTSWGALKAEQQKEILEQLNDLACLNFLTHLKLPELQAITQKQLAALIKKEMEGSANIQGGIASVYTRLNQILTFCHQSPIATQLLSQGLIRLDTDESTVESLLNDKHKNNRHYLYYLLWFSVKKGCFILSSPLSRVSSSSETPIFQHRECPLKEAAGFYKTLKHFENAPLDMREFYSNTQQTRSFKPNLRRIRMGISADITETEVSENLREKEIQYHEHLELFKQISAAALVRSALPRKALPPRRAHRPLAAPATLLTDEATAAAAGPASSARPGFATVDRKPPEARVTPPAFSPPLSSPVPLIVLSASEKRVKQLQQKLDAYLLCQVLSDKKIESGDAYVLEKLKQIKELLEIKPGSSEVILIQNIELKRLADDYQDSDFKPLINLAPPVHYVSPATLIGANPEQIKKNKKAELCIKAIIHYLKNPEQKSLLRQADKDQDALDQILESIFGKPSPSISPEKYFIPIALMALFDPREQQGIFEEITKNLNYQEKAELNRRLQKFGMTYLVPRVTLTYLRDEFKSLSADELYEMQEIASRSLLKDFQIQETKDAKGKITVTFAQSYTQGSPQTLLTPANMREWKNWLRWFISNEFSINDFNQNLSSVTSGSDLGRISLIPRVTDFFCMTLLHNLKLTSLSVNERAHLLEFIKSTYFNKMPIYEAINATAEYLATLVTTFHAHPASLSLLSMGLIHFIDRSAAESMLTTSSFPSSYLMRVSSSDPNSIIFSTKIEGRITHESTQNNRPLFLEKMKEQTQAIFSDDPLLCTLLYIERSGLNLNPDLSVSSTYSELSSNAPLVPVVFNKRILEEARDESLLHYYRDHLVDHLISLRDKFSDELWRGAQELTVSKEISEEKWKDFALVLIEQKAEQKFIELKPEEKTAVIERLTDLACLTLLNQLKVPELHPKTRQQLASFIKKEMEKSGKTIGQNIAAVYDRLNAALEFCDSDCKESEGDPASLFKRGLSEGFVIFEQYDTATMNRQLDVNYSKNKRANYLFWFDGDRGADQDFVYQFIKENTPPELKPVSSTPAPAALIIPGAPQSLLTPVPLSVLPFPPTPVPPRVLPSAILALPMIGARSDFPVTTPGFSITPALPPPLFPLSTPVPPTLPLLKLL